MDAIPGLRDGLIVLWGEKKPVIDRPGYQFNGYQFNDCGQALLITPRISAIRARTIRI
jgi:hypothetical protein